MRFATIVGVERDSMAKLGEACLGDATASEEAMRDLLRELANTASGAFVRAAAEEGISLTCGLPVDLAAGALGASPQGSRQQFVIAPRDNGLRVVFEVGILAKALRRLCVTQLKEGMVLARDLHAETGVMLVPAGTRLTSTQIARLGGILSPRFTFDVAEAA